MKTRKSINRLLGFILALMLAIPAAEYATTYYASPTGTGSTCSLASPGTVVACLGVAAADDTLILKNGTYTGDAYMLHPPTNRSGTSGHPITITAETDGSVLIDGQFARIPVLWDHNDWWVVSGFNAAHSSSDVMSIYPGSDNNIFNRICAWDANPNGNNLVWQFWQATGNLAVDTCAFGSGRKMYASFELSGLTLRRPFAMWNHINVDSGPFITYSLFYDSDHVIIENAIGTRDEDADSFPDGATDQGIFSADRLDEYSDCEIHSGYYGGLAIILNTQNILQSQNHGGEIHGSQVAGSVTFQDDLLYITPGSHLDLRRILMAQYDATFTAGCAANTLTANRKMTNVTSIGQADASFPNLIDTSTPNNGWTNTNFTDVNSIAAIYPGSGETLYVGSAGTKLRYQYQNGVLTTTPLWPWPMNQRIINAMLLAGRTPFDVNATVTGLFGISPDVNPAGTPPVDNFDTYTSGTDLNGDNANTGSGWTSAWTYGENGVMTTEVAPGGGQGGKAVRSNSAAGDSTYYYRQFTGVSAGIFTWEMSSSITNPTSDQYGVSLHEAGVGKRTEVHFGTTGNIEAYDGLALAWNAVCPYSVNVRYRIYEELDGVGHPNKYRVKCGISGTFTSWIGSTGTLSVVNLFQINDASANAHTFWIDAVGSVSELITVSPSTGAKGTTLSFTTTGTGTAWANGTSAATFNPSTNLTVNSTTVGSTTSATVNVTIAAGAASTARDVIMTTGNEGETNTGGFTITGTCTPDHLIFQTQPSNAALGVSVGPLNVAIVDSLGTICTSDTSTVTLSKHAGTCTGMTLNGTVSGAAVAGIFSTSNVNMTVTIGACSLNASDGALTGATSNSFTVGPVSGAGTSRIRSLSR